MSDPIAETARTLAEARLALAPVGVLPTALRPASEDDAYRVQAAVHALIAPTRIGRRIGYKVACTTKVMQDYLGVDSPVFAGLFAGTVHEAGQPMRLDDYRRLGIECELAVTIGRDVVGGSFDAASIAGVVDSYMPAFEIVDDRYENWRITDTPTLVADDFFAAGARLGAPVAAAAIPDPESLSGVLTINGEEVGRGRGSDILGHPMSALAWLANALSRRNRPLRRGETVLLGSLVETKWVARGDNIRFSVDGLGTIETAVT